MMIIKVELLENICRIAFNNLLVASFKSPLNFSSRWFPGELFCFQ